LNLTEGDMVAVEASPGHDIGAVSLTGELVREQMKRKGVPYDGKLRIIYRKVKPADIEKWEAATQRENQVMLKARKITKDLNLKIGHAVLVVFEGGKTYLLDNQIKSVVETKTVRHYKPVYSINDKAWWRHRS